MNHTPGAQAEPAAVDPKETAQRLQGLRAEWFNVDDLTGRRRTSARLLDALTDRLDPFPAPAETIAELASLSATALGLLMVLVEAIKVDSALELAVRRGWTERVARLAESNRVAERAAAGLAFEQVLGRTVRSAGAAMSVEQAVSNPARAEWLIRALCQALDVPTRRGRREESAARRRQALDRLDPAKAESAERRLAYEQRFARVLATLEQDLAKSGALPDAVTYRSL